MAAETSTSWSQSVINWFADYFANRLIDFIKWVTETAFYLFDKFLIVFTDMINNFPVPASWANSNPWANLAPQVLYLLDKFQIVEVLAILAAGWTIRFMLNTIPFLRI